QRQGGRERGELLMVHADQMQQRKVGRLRRLGEPQPESANDSSFDGSSGCPSAACERGARQQGSAQRRHHARHGLTPIRTASGSANPPAVRESATISPTGLDGYRVQIVNVNRATKKCGIKSPPEQLFKENAAGLLWIGGVVTGSRQSGCPARTHALAVSSSFMTVITSRNSAASPVVRFTSSAPCKAAKM